MLVAAFKKAVQRLTTSRGADPSVWTFTPGGIGVPGQPPIAYSNRGSYIQLVELRPGKAAWGRNVLPPGVAESGPHMLDQTALARSWLYKPMLWFKSPE